MSHKILEKKTSNLFQEIKPLDLHNNPFHLFAKDWFLMTAEIDKILVKK